MVCVVVLLAGASAHADEAASDDGAAPVDGSAIFGGSGRGLEYRTLRFDEDWSALDQLGSGGKGDVYDRFKRIALWPDESVTLSLGAEIRSRVEVVRNYRADTPGLVDGDDAFWLNRARFHADIQSDTYFRRLFLEGIGAFSFERSLPGGRRPQDVNEIDLQNAFLDLHVPFPFDVGSLTVRTGRQELLFGAERHVSPYDWQNARQTFDGVDGIWEFGDWDVHTFYVRPVRMEKYSFNNADSGQDFFGIYATGPLCPWMVEEWGTSTPNVDLYVLGVNQDSSASVPVFEPGTPNNSGSERFNAGGRFWGELGCGFDYDIEGAVQVGEIGPVNLFAVMGAAELGYTLADAPTRPRIHIGVDYGSGDDDPGGDAETYSPLFPNAHDQLGIADIVSRRNIYALNLGVDLEAVENRLSIGVDGFYFLRAENGDAVYDVDGGVLKANGLGGSGSMIGGEIDLVARLRVNDHWTHEVGYARFFAGDFLEDSGTADDTDFFYFAFRYIF